MQRLDDKRFQHGLRKVGRRLDALNPVRVGERSTRPVVVQCAAPLLSLDESHIVEDADSRVVQGTRRRR